MNITGTYYPSAPQNYTKHLKQKNNSFATSMNEKKIENNNNTNNPKFKLDPATFTSVRIPNLNDEPVEVNLDNLNSDQISMLKEKYDINSIKPNSQQFNELMDELCKLGVLSDIPYPSESLGSTYRFDANGKMISCLTKIQDVKQNSLPLMDWLTATSNQYKEQYDKLPDHELMSDNDKMFATQYVSHSNIKSALQNIFGNQ